MSLTPFEIEIKKRSQLYLNQQCSYDCYMYNIINELEQIKLNVIHHRYKVSKSLRILPLNVIDYKDHKKDLNDDLDRLEKLENNINKALDSLHVVKCRIDKNKYDKQLILDSLKLSGRDQ